MTSQRPDQNNFVIYFINLCHFPGCRQGPRSLSASGRQSLTGSWGRNTSCRSLWTGNTASDWSILIILSSDWLAASSWTRITTPGARTRRGSSTRKRRGSGSTPAPERLSSVSLTSNVKFLWTAQKKIFEKILRSSPELSLIYLWNLPLTFRNL